MRIRNSLITLSVLGLLAACSTGQVSKDDEGRTSSLVRPSALQREQAALRARQVAHVTYNLWFGLDETQEEFQGRVVINFDLREKARDLSSTLLLDFEGGAIRSMTLNGVAVPEPAFDGHRVHLKSAELQPGSNRVEIAFTHPFSKTGNGLHRFVDPVDGKVYLYSNFEPYDAHRMFPCFDQPDLKASFELAVEAPEEWEVISNTVERETTVVDGRASWAFPPSPVFSTYVFALHAGPYAEWKSEAEGIPLRLFARRSIAQHVDHAEWLDVTGQGLEYFNTQFGYPYPYSKYDQVIVPDFNSGAMENVAAVTFSERFVFRSKATVDRHRGRATTILHEMAHMWFGNLVTMRWWNGLWLNESFATFMAARAVDEGTKFKGTWQGFFGQKRGAYWQDQTVITHPIELPVPDTDHAFANFDAITYGKGAAVLKQLRYYLGEDDFREGVQRYFHRFALRNTTLADFMKMLSEASGRNLAEWQKVWLQTAGVNTVAADWACEDGKISRFTLKQARSEAGPELRPHRTQIALYRWPKKGPRTSLQKYEKLEAVYGQGDASAPTPVAAARGKPCPDFVDPNHEDMDYVKVEFDPESLKTLYQHGPRIDDGLSRQMIWHSLWEMVQDGKITALNFGKMALEHLGRETDTQVVSQVLSSLAASDANRTTVLKIMDARGRDDFRQKVEDFTFKRLLAAAPGGDLQLVWLGGFRSVARSPKALEFLRALVDGKRKVSGLRIDTDRRWEITQALARAGGPDVFDRILVELKKDPTDMGKKASIGAEASIPDAEIKGKWLKRILRTGDAESAKLKNADLRNAMDSFQVLGREELITATVDPYFEALPKLAETEDEDYIHSFTSRMYPSLCDAKLAERTGAFLAAHTDLPATMIKSLRVFRQEEERCVRARALLHSGGPSHTNTLPVKAPKNVASPQGDAGSWNPWKR